ncbi:MAG: hypothetical protein ACE10G_09770 [Gemmatimonadales bacterium]
MVPILDPGGYGSRGFWLDLRSRRPPELAGHERSRGLDGTRAKNLHTLRRLPRHAFEESKEIRTMAMPSDIGIIDTMIGFPATDFSH